MSMRNSLSKRMIPNAFKSKKCALLKKTVIDLESALSDLNAQVKATTNENTMTVKELEKLQIRYDILKIKSAKEIEDLARELKEQQTMREEEQRLTEDKLQELKEDYERRLQALQSECDRRVRAVSLALAREMKKSDSASRQSAEDVARLRREHEKAIREMELKIQGLERERRSLKTLVQLCRNTITKRVMGQAKSAHMNTQRNLHQLLADN